MTVDFEENILKAFGSFATGVAVAPHIKVDLQLIHSPL